MLVETGECLSYMQEDACRLSEADSVATSIGAVNTLIRKPDGSLAGYNTDWDAAISAVEHALAGDGKTSLNLIQSSCAKLPDVFFVTLLDRLGESATHLKSLDTGCVLQYAPCLSLSATFYRNMCTCSFSSSSLCCVSRFFSGCEPKHLS